MNYYNIKNYNNRHKGFSDLIEFKGVITIPYAWSTWTLFEYISLNLIVFIPSPSFLLRFLDSKLNFWYQNDIFLKKYINISEWYCEENKQFFIYFDSWHDLRNKINNLDYKKHKQDNKKFSENHKNIILKKWENILYNYY